MNSLLLVTIIVLLIIILSRLKSAKNNIDIKRSIDQLNEKITELVKHVSALQKEKESYRKEVASEEIKQPIVTPITTEQPIIQPAETTFEHEINEAEQVTATEQIAKPPESTIEEEKISTSEYNGTSTNGTCTSRTK